MTNEEILEFIKTIPFNELFDKIREVTGLDDLEFNTEIHTDYRGTPRPVYCSQDLADRAGFLGLMFKKLVIKQFNSSVAYNEEHGGLYYWGTVSFSYEHHPCGSNGHDFMTVWYEPFNGGWVFRLNKEAN